MINKIDSILKEQSYEILRRMLGRRLLSIIYDSKEPGHMVGIAQLNFEEGGVLLYPQEYVLDYFGAPEDVIAIEIREDSLQWLRNPDKYYEFPVGKVISSISVVNYHIRWQCDGEPVYDNDLTAGIVFTLDDGEQISCERVDEFLMQIYVQTGTDLIHKLAPIDIYFDTLDSPWKVTESKVNVIEVKKEE